MCFKLNFVSYQCSQWHKLRWETLFDISFLICNPLKKNFSMFTQKLTNSNARLVFSPLTKMFWLYMTRFLLNFSQLLGKPLWSGRVLVLDVLGCVHLKVFLYLCLCLVLVSVFCVSCCTCLCQLLYLCLRTSVPNADECVCYLSYSEITSTPLSFKYVSYLTCFSTGHAC